MLASTASGPGRSSARAVSYARSLVLASFTSALIAGVAFARSAPPLALPRDFVQLYPAPGDTDGVPLGVHIGPELVHVYDAEGPSVAWHYATGERRPKSLAWNRPRLAKNERLVFVDGDALPLIVTFSQKDGAPVVASVGLPDRQDDDLPLAEAPGRVLHASADRQRLFVVDRDEHFPERGRLSVAAASGAALGRFHRPGLFGVRATADGNVLLALHASGVSVLDGGAQPTGAELPFARDARLAPDGSAAVLLGLDSATIWSRGNVVGRVDFPSPPLDASIAPALGARRAAIVSATRFVLVDVDSGAVLATRDLPAGAARQHSVDLARDGRRWAIGSLSITQRDTGGGNGRARALVTVVNEGSPPSAREEFETSSWNSRSPEVRLLPGGDVLVSTPDAVRVLEVP